MSLPTTIKNTETEGVIFGVPDDQTAYMILQSYEVRRNGTFADVRDETGKIVLRTNYDEDMTITVTGVMDKTKTESIPSVGTVATFTGDVFVTDNKLVVESIQVTGSNTDHLKLTVTLRWFFGIDTPVLG